MTSGHPRSAANRVSHRLRQRCVSSWQSGGRDGHGDWRVSFCMSGKRTPEDSQRFSVVEIIREWHSRKTDPVIEERILNASSLLPWDSNCNYVKQSSSNGSKWRKSWRASSHWGWPMLGKAKHGKSGHMKTWQLSFPCLICLSSSLPSSPRLCSPSPPRIPFYFRRKHLAM